MHYGNILFDAKQLFVHVVAPQDVVSYSRRVSVSRITVVHHRGNNSTYFFVVDIFYDSTTRGPSRVSSAVVEVETRLKGMGGFLSWV